MYDMVDFAIGRLVQTTIKIKGVPSTILRINADREVKYVHLIEQEMRYISLDDEGVDLTPLKVGYLNCRRGASYLVRDARRRWKQGLDQQGISVEGDNYLVHDFYSSQEFLDCLEGKYPSLLEATFTAKDKHKSVAFNRKWAVGPTEELYYRGKIVGNSKDGLHLNEVYKYLKELLEEVL